MGRNNFLFVHFLYFEKQYCGWILIIKSSLLKKLTIELKNEIKEKDKDSWRIKDLKKHKDGKLEKKQ